MVLKIGLIYTKYNLFFFCLILGLNVTLSGSVRSTLVNVFLGWALNAHVSIWAEGNNEAEAEMFEMVYICPTSDPWTLLLNNIRYRTASFHRLSFTSARQIYFLASCCISSDWSYTGLISFRKRYTSPGLSENLLRFPRCPSVWTDTPSQKLSRLQLLWFLIDYN